MRNRRRWMALLLVAVLAACSGGEGNGARGITEDEIRRIAQEVGQEHPDNCPILETDQVREAIRIFDPGDVTPRQKGELQGQHVGPAVVRDDLIICDWVHAGTAWNFRVLLTGGTEFVDDLVEAMEADARTDSSDIALENGRVSESSYSVVESSSAAINFRLDASFIDARPSVDEMRQVGDLLLEKVRQSLAR